MITKLDRLQGRDIYENTALAKINELVDAINELQESQNTYWTDIAEIKKELQTRAENVQPDAESRSENVQDKFAEQEKWVGKLCKFWDDDPNDYVFDKLKEITFAGCYIKESGFIYEHCEPVKPDSELIYHGE